MDHVRGQGRSHGLSRGMSRSRSLGPSGRLARGVLAGLVLLAPVAGTPLAASADEGGATAEAPGQLELVLDASGSMAAQDPSGGRKIDAARAALGQVVDAVPTGAAVAVRAYGGRFADKERGCADTRLLVPLGPAEPVAARAALAGLQPVGHTPVAASLRAAAQDLAGGEGQKTVVLVSDGEETCGGDPCAVARELAAGGVRLRVDTVGYGADAGTEDQLRCISRATGGEYTAAPDAQALTASLTRVSDRAYKTYQPKGTPVRGGATVTEAPLLRPGQYLDSIAPGATRYYAVQLADGVTPYLATTLVRPPGKPASAYDRLDYSLQTQAGKSCGTSSATPTNQTFGGTPTTGVVAPGTVGATGPGGQVRWSGGYSTSAAGCGEAGRYTLGVTRSSTELGEAALPLELLVLLEPPVADADALPPAATPLPPALPLPQSTGEVRATEPGASFNDAVALRPGSYRTSIEQGETLFFKTPVDWGQRLNLAAQVLRPDGAPQTDLRFAPLYLTVYNPARQALDGDLGEDFASWNSSATAPAQVSLSGPPVVWRNRQVSTSELKPEALAGDHYVALHLGAQGQQLGYPLDLRLTLEVTGSRSGAPRYAGAVGTDAAPPASGTPQSTGPTASATAGPRATTPTDGAGLPLRRVAYTGGGVLAVLAAGALLLQPWLGRRRRTASGGWPAGTSTYDTQPAWAPPGDAPPERHHDGGSGGQDGGWGWGGGSDGGSGWGGGSDGGSGWGGGSDGGSGWGGGSDGGGSSGGSDSSSSSS